MIPEENKINKIKFPKQGRGWITMSSEQEIRQKGG